MRFNNTTASSLSSLPVRIDHGNAAAAGSPAMNANTTRTAYNMSVDAVPTSLAGTEHPQHVSYLHALQHGSSTRLPAMERNSTNPHLTPDVLSTSPFAHVGEQHPFGASGDSGFTPVVSLRRYTRSTRAHVDPDHLNTMAASIHQVPSPAPTAFEALTLQ